MMKPFKSATQRMLNSSYADGLIKKITNKNKPYKFWQTQPKANSKRTDGIK